MRGPVVYAFEGLDQPGCDLDALVIDPTTPWTPVWKPDLLGGVMLLEGVAREAKRLPTGAVALEPPRPVTAIPYFAWANRGPTPMQVWMAADVEAALPAPLPTLASRSKATSSFGGDVSHLSDRREPTSSIDHDSPYCHWWPKKGETVWLQYDFPEPVAVHGVDVYWFDDTGRGECRVPDSWQVLMQKDGAWVPVEGQTQGGLQLNTYNRVTFPVQTVTALRISVKSQAGFAGGIHEWRVLAP